MPKLSSIGLCVALSASSAQGWAQTVVPTKGQSSQQTQLDMNECQSIAASQAASTNTSPSGGRVKGAAAGAAAGATAAGVRGNQHEVYENANSNVQQEYRQNQAKGAAAAGAVVGGSRQRQERRANEKTSTANSQAAYTSCLQGKGYQVNP